MYNSNIIHIFTTAKNRIMLKLNHKYVKHCLCESNKIFCLL